MEETARPKKYVFFFFGAGTIYRFSSLRVWNIFDAGAERGNKFMVSPGQQKLLVMIRGFFYLVKLPVLAGVWTAIQGAGRARMELGYDTRILLSC